LDLLEVLPIQEREKKNQPKKDGRLDASAEELIDLGSKNSRPGTISKGESSGGGGSARERNEVITKYSGKLGGSLPGENNFTLARKKEID